MGYSSSWPPWTGRGCSPECVATQTGNICKNTHITFTVGYSSSWPPWTGRGCCPGYVATQTGSKKTEPLLWGIHHPGHPGLAMAAAPGMGQPKLEARTQNLYCGVFIILATLDWPWLLPRVWGNPNCKQEHTTFTVGYSSSWPPWTGRGC